MDLKMMQESQKIKLAFLLLSDILIMTYGKPAIADPPVWAYHHEYELFQKIYDQTQAIQKQLIRALYTPKKCPDSWTAILDSCYFLPLHWKNNWLDAEETCERLGGYLAILNSEEEDSEVSAYLSEVSSRDLQEVTSYIWIGGFDFVQEGDWRWVSGESFNYTNWRVPPEDRSAELRKEENCLDWSEGWNDNSCSQKLHFLCERDKV